MRGKIRDTLAAALVLEMHVPEVGEWQHEVVLGDGLGVADEVAGAIGDTNPRVVKLGEDLESVIGFRQQVRVGLDAETNASCRRAARSSSAGARGADAHVHSLRRTSGRGGPVVAGSSRSQRCQDYLG